MFKIVVVVISMVTGVPVSNPVRYTSADQFELASDCEAALAKSLPVLLADLNAALHERGAPKNVEVVVRTADCEFYEADPASDNLANILRDMIRGGGFGTMRP